MRAKPDRHDGGEVVNREDLFEKHVRGDLTAAELAALKQLLASDPEAGRAFVEYANETALLIRVGAQFQSKWPADNVVLLPSLDARSGPVSDPVVHHESTPARNRPMRWVKLSALAACLVGLAIVLTMSNREREAVPVRIPEVYVTGEGIQITRGGASLTGEDVELLDGDVIATATNKTAMIIYDREFTRVSLQPATVLVFGGAAQGKLFELRRGTIEVLVAPQPAERPMSIHTAHALATVLGTEFVMRADERATKLDVLDGKVRLACRATGKTVKVKAGFAATLNRKAPFNVAPLCKTNCILREGPDTTLFSKSSSTNRNE
jgi:ferric-dicitrate binding protein FerR (iron transport regulator)